jgi:hypothetical protein
MQQCVHFSGGWAGSGRFTRAQSHRQNAACRGQSTWESFTGTARSYRLSLAESENYQSREPILAGRLCAPATPQVGPLPAPGEAGQVDRRTLSREQLGSPRIHARSACDARTAGVTSRDLLGHVPISLAGYTVLLTPTAYAMRACLKRFSENYCELLRKHSATPCAMLNRRSSALASGQDHPILFSK